MITTETSVWNVSVEKVIWSGTAQTTAPSDLASEAKDYASLIVGALKKKGLL